MEIGAGATKVVQTFVIAKFNFKKVIVGFC